MSTAKSQNYTSINKNLYALLVCYIDSYFNGRLLSYPTVTAKNRKTATQVDHTVPSYLLSTCLMETKAVSRVSIQQ